jgi:hypothetical protein
MTMTTNSSRYIRASFAVFALMLACTSSAFARGNWQGYIERGGSVSASLSASIPAQIVPAGSGATSGYVTRNYPLATCSVFRAGTLTLATIYSDNAGTPKANPSTADTASYFRFYADNGRYDVRCSGGGIITPFTFPDIVIDDSSSGDTSGIVYVNAAATSGTGTAASPWTGWDSAIAWAGVAGTGTIVVNIGAGAIVTGTGAHFTTEAKTGQYVMSGRSYGIITNITNDNQLTVDYWRGVNKSGAAYTFYVPTTYYAPDGWYALSSTLELGYPHLAFIGGAKTILKYTGTGAITQLTSVNNNVAIINGVRLENLRLYGSNAGSTYGISFGAAAHVYVDNVFVKDVSTAGFFVNGVISSNFQRLRVSGNEEIYTTVPTDGLYIQSCNGCNFVSNTFDSLVAGSGVKVANGSNNTFTGLVSEGNLYGFWNGVTGGTTYNTQAINPYFEANTTADFYSQGIWTVLDNPQSASGKIWFYHPTPGAILYSAVRGGRMSTIQIDTNASGVTLYGPSRYGESSGTYTSSNANVVIMGCVANTSGVCLPQSFADHFGFAQSLVGSVPTAPSNGGTTGLGIGGSGAFDATSSDTSLRVTYTTAGTPSAAGTTFVSFARAYTNPPRLVCSLQDGTGTWASTAQCRISNVAAGSYRIEWANGGAALTAAQTYAVTVLTVAN